MILETPASGGGRARRRPWFHLSLPASLLFALAPGSSAAQPLTFQNVLVDPGGSGDDKIVADIDLDGYADGVVGGRETFPGSKIDELYWYESSGPGRSFTMHYLRTSSIEFTTDIEAVDVDVDGDFDLVFADGNVANAVQWLENPRLSPPVGVPPDPTQAANWTDHTIGTLSNYAHDIEFGLIDADGLPDILAVGDGGPFRIFFQNAGGTWSMSDFSQHSDNGSPAIADIDGDGDRDIFVRGGWIESPQANRRDPNNWTFHAITNSDPGDGPAVLALDIDRDGKIDLVTCPQHERGDLAWFRNPANPETANWPRQVISDSAGSHHLRAADFDGDGRTDLMTGLELSQGDITVWRVSGSGPTPIFTPVPVATGGGGHNAAVGDLDGNGLPDVWAADWIGNPPLRAYFNGPNVIFRDGFETGNTSKWSLGS